MSELEEGTPGKDSLRSQIARRRWMEECKGIVYDGVRFSGDAGSRQSVTESLEAARQYEAKNGEGSFSTHWKGVDGWITVGLSDLEAIHEALAMRRQDCFNRERELLDAVEAGQEISLGSGWPDYDNEMAEL